MWATNTSSWVALFRTRASSHEPAALTCWPTRQHHEATPNHLGTLLFVDVAKLPTFIPASLPRPTCHITIAVDSSCSSVSNFAFDLLIVSDKDYHNERLIDRKQELRRLLNRVPAISRLQYVDLG
jgi:hypothetical protein